jgi:type IV fimbrial biogenesis protein FimT
MLMRRPQRGFTMIELLITIVIVAILAAIAFPSFQSLLANAQIRTAAQALHDGLQLARVEAIRRNERVVFTKGTESGWTVSTDAGGNVLQTRPYTEGSKAATVTVTPSTATKVTFNALGRVVANTDASSSIIQLAIDVPPSVLAADISQNLQIDVTTGGSIRLCDPNVAAGVGKGC